MKELPRYQERFQRHKCCVLIPTYNNGSSLKNVLQDVAGYTRNVIVVNDGSTDETEKILDHFSWMRVIHLPVNSGKGSALKKGFKEASKEGFQYVITMDSDGQHFPDDLVVFLDALDQKNPADAEPLVIGSREMNHPDIPNKSTVGNRFSSFWFWVETGIKLQDTQCGYRLYPLSIINQLTLVTSKFELEIEVIVKAAWKGADVMNLPVKVFYDPGERVTHFRPFQDVVRITLLNIWFVIFAVFYIAPRNLLRRLIGSKTVVSKRMFSETKLPLK